MWLTPTTQLLLLMAAAPTGVTTTQQPSRPIATRQTVFTIPYSVDRVDLASGGQVEVQLLVSSDGGRSQRLHARDRIAAETPAIGTAPSIDTANRPVQRQFVFQADRDGEYWFWLRVVDRSGAVQRPSDGPGLRVLVDTVPPTLRLQAQRGPAGQLSVHWEVDESNPSAEGHKIEYRTASDRPWQPVAISARNVRSVGSTQSGDVSWWPEAGAPGVQIRVEVADAAGNRAVSHQQVGQTGIVSTGQGFQGGPNPQDNRPPPSPNWPPAPPRIPAPNDTVGTTTQWPADQHVATPSQWDRNSGYPPANPGPTDPVPSPTNPPIGNRYIPPAGPNDTTGNLGTGNLGTGDLGTGNLGLPPGVRPQMQNAKLFDLHYDAESTAPSGIVRVELWGTRDGGRNWSSYALDKDSQSPMLVSVQEEGIYGFRIVAQDRAGYGDKPPQSGDAPEIWIGVDFTRPHAKILSIDPGQGAETGQMVISWEAGDWMLAAQPVSLFYRENVGVGWVPIATRLANTGRHAWVRDRRLPENLQFRLEVRDAAGNVGTFETTNAAPSAPSDRFRPTGRIQGVHPVGVAAMGPPRRW